MKKALREASFFLSQDQRSKLQAFIQAARGVQRSWSAHRVHASAECKHPGDRNCAPSCQEGLRRENCFGGLLPPTADRARIRLQAPGNYNSQSGEIVGVLKNMLDTFQTNLASAPLCQLDSNARRPSKWMDF